MSSAVRGLAALAFIAIAITGRGVSGDVPPTVQLPPAPDRGLWQQTANATLPFEGIGALSAGANARLLLDYPSPQREQILDFLFLPQYGAALQTLKIEIGAGAQSTDGSEPSIQPDSEDQPVRCLSTVGYEFWLAQEAVKRNPGIHLSALSWGAPGWVTDPPGGSAARTPGGSLYTKKHIEYQIRFATCFRLLVGKNLDSIGVWNENGDWGGEKYVRELRVALNSAGLDQTIIVLLDGWLTPAFIETLNFNLIKALHPVRLGFHYACAPRFLAHWDELQAKIHADPRLAQLWDSRVVSLWASEEWSTPADWEGAGCWGRVLNTNAIRLNITSTVAWSLVWSVYPNLECFGNGLLYAFTPWSGSYQVNPTIWTSAHTTHFTFPARAPPLLAEKVHVPSGAGSRVLTRAELAIPGTASFMSYVLYGNPDGSVALVVEGLGGRCMYNNGCFHEKDFQRKLQPAQPDGKRTTAALVRFPSGCAGCSFRLFTTTRTSYFFEKKVAANGEGTVVFQLPDDGIVTVTNVTDRFSAVWSAPQRELRERALADNGAAYPDPSRDKFPFPFAPDWGDSRNETTPPYFSDQQGDFVIVQPPLVEGGVREANCVRPAESLEIAETQMRLCPVLRQRQRLAPLKWGGGARCANPLTVIGDGNWTDYRVSVTGVLSEKKSNRLCARVIRFEGFRQSDEVAGYCVAVWREANAEKITMTAGPVVMVAEQKIERDSDGANVVSLAMELSGGRVSVFVDRKLAFSVVDGYYPIGSAALGCDWGADCAFWAFEVAPLGGRAGALVQKNDLSATATAAEQPAFAVRTEKFDYHARTCSPNPAQPALKTDAGPARLGFAFRTADELSSGNLKRPTPAIDRLSITSVGRLRLPANKQTHLLEIYRLHDSHSFTLQAKAVVDFAHQNFLNGTDPWQWATLSHPLTLSQKGTYVLVSVEGAPVSTASSTGVGAATGPDSSGTGARLGGGGGSVSEEDKKAIADVWMDTGSLYTTSVGAPVAIIGSATFDGTRFNITSDGSSYGPLNMRVSRGVRTARPDQDSEDEVIMF